MLFSLLKHHTLLYWNQVIFFTFSSDGNLFLKFNEPMNGAAETDAEVSNSLHRVQAYALRWDLIDIFFSSVKSGF